MLAGGASRRFGSDKALAPVGESTMLARTIATVRAAGCDPVVVLGGPARAHLGVPVLADRLPGEGPLVAVVDALRWLGAGHLLVVPCDHPCLRTEHLRRILDVPTDPNTAVVASVDGVPQASIGRWPAAWGPALHVRVRHGARALRTLTEHGPSTMVDLPAEALADADTPTELARLTDPAHLEESDDRLGRPADGRAEHGPGAPGA